MSIVGNNALMNENPIQQRVRLLAANSGWLLWRNNVGVYIDKRGIPVRYGLANDTSAMNKRIKSADLIGIRPVLITPDMVGKIIGQFVSIEVKRSDWKPGADPEREQAQQHWADIVNEQGGYAKFSTGEL